MIDSAGLPKPAYHAIRRELAALAMQARRDDQELTLWVVSAAAQPHDLEVCLDVYTLGGDHLRAQLWSVRAGANAVTPLEPTELPEDAVAFLRLLDGGEEISRAALWPEPLKHFNLPDPLLSAALSGRSLTIKTTLPAKGIWVDAAAARPSDNHLDLQPGESVTLEFDADVEPADLSVRAVGSVAPVLLETPPTAP